MTIRTGIALTVFPQNMSRVRLPTLTDLGIICGNIQLVNCVLDIMAPSPSALCTSKLLYPGHLHGQFLLVHMR